MSNLRHDHYVRRNGVALEILRAIDAFAKRTPELTRDELKLAQLELLYQMHERDSRNANVRDQIVLVAIDLVHHYRARSAQMHACAAVLGDAVDAYCVCDNVIAPSNECPAHGKK